jgi:cyclopropane-fatty-acyl-phospholipid synthase
MEDTMGRAQDEKFVKDLLLLAGITVNGKRSFDIQIHNPAFYSRILREQVLGLGESYMDAWWDCEALDEFINRIIRADLEKEVKGDWKILWHALKSRLFNLQTRRKAFHIADVHYNLGNDLYQAMLDKRLNYSCAYWQNATNLDEAQEAKLDLICRKIELEPGMSVLDLGCGFGGFARYAAEKYQARVTGYTVSDQQVNLGREMCRELPVEFKLEDYRQANGQFDRVISIGFMEHVGYRNYSTYMDVVDRCLKPDGIALLHTIGSNVSKSHSNAWTSKYIFPNGVLPSIAQISQASEKVFVIEDLHNFGPHYDKTLLAWYENFNTAWPQLREKYGDRFYRMWRYYLLSCAGGFRARGTQLWQFVMTRQGRTQPSCRLG